MPSWGSLHKPASKKDMWGRCCSKLQAAKTHRLLSKTVTKCGCTGALGFSINWYMCHVNQFIQSVQFGGLALSEADSQTPSHTLTLRVNRASLITVMAVHTNLNVIIGICLFCVILQHILGHHPFTNIDGVDPDIVPINTVSCSSYCTLW